MDTAPEENGKKVLTMAEYINRDAVHDLVRSLTKYAWTSPDNTVHRVTVDADDVNFGVDKIPSADVAPVRHGRWIRPHWKNSNYCCDCSECGGEAMHREYQWNKNGIYPICPNCGAKMDLEAEYDDQ